MENPDNFFQDKRALVTGGASGIGKGIALALVQKGAQVVVFDIDEENLELLRRELPQIETRNVDLRDWNRTQEATKSILPLDLLVNNAGYSTIAPITEVTEEKFNYIFDVNIKSYFNVTQVVVENLIKNEMPGSIVNISSIATSVPLCNTTLYTSSKAAVDGFTKALALELAPQNIRVNSVNPALVKTNLSKGLWENEELLQATMRRMPLQRTVTPEDVADAVLFLLSDKAKMITGTCLAVDAGHAVSF